MSKSSQKAQLDASLFPSPAGYREKKPTLCIGLDIAWFGGSRSDPSSRYDFLAAALLDSELNVKQVEHLRVRLSDHDLDAKETATGLNALIKKCGAKVGRIVLAIDAPLQAISRGLPLRTPIPRAGAVKRRACEEYLNCKRKSIDGASGVANGWHPNIQPGAPIAPRVESLLHKLDNPFKLWTRENSEQQEIIIECFPAEAIWGAKRMGWFAGNIGASQAKEYKKQKSKQLTAKEVTKLIETVLLPFGYMCSGQFWKTIVDQILGEILKDGDWKRDCHYPGGKMLDDVVDSMICLATAISYTAGNAHVWQDLNHPDDGHIIGPGTMQELLTGRIRLVASSGATE